MTQRIAEVMLSARTEPIHGHENVSLVTFGSRLRLLCRNDDPAEIRGASRNWLRERSLVAGREVQAEGAAWLKVQTQEDIVTEELNGGSHWCGGWAGSEGWIEVTLERTAKQAQLTGERTPTPSSEQ